MRVSRSLAVAVCVAQFACTRTPTSPARDPASEARRPIEAVSISSEAFAGAAREVFQSGAASPHRLGLLVSVVRRQLERARAYFDAGHDDVGLDSVRAAFYTLRSGELRPEMLEGHASTLAKAADVFSRRGSEGQAEALYTMLVELTPEGPERGDAAEHLSALRRWQSDTRRPGSMQARAAAQKTALHRALLDPSATALAKAHEETRAWVSQALTFGGDRTPPRSHFEQDETIAAFRAVRTAALTLVGLYLRQGDALGALRAVEEDEMARITAPSLRERLERAGDDSDPQAWVELFRLYESAEEADATGSAISDEVARAASWGAALELYRTDPADLNDAVPLAALLLSHGLSEVAPLVLEAPLARVQDPKATSWAMRLVLEGIGRAEALGDLEGARRTFQHSATLLQLAVTPNLAGRVEPSPSRLYYQMGSLEARAGELDAARPLLQKAIELSPTTEALRLLASIERQRGDRKAALAALDRVLAMPLEGEDPASRAETLRLRFELLREMGKPDEAASSLLAALQAGLKARNEARTRPSLAYAERVVGRVLEHYGEHEAAHRAGKRAYEASRNDLRQMTQTVLDSSRRALTLGDIRAARESVRRALSVDLADEDTVYAALWLKLVEKRLGVTSDGTVEEALASIDTETGWIAKLTAWGRGRLTDEQLLSSAENRTEKVEAMFYLAMSGPRTPQSLNQLQEVASSEAIQLVEVTIARDLIAGRQQLPTPPLPSDVQLP